MNGKQKTNFLNILYFFGLVFIVYFLYLSIKFFSVFSKIYGGENLVNGFLLAGGLILFDVFLVITGLKIIGKLRK